MNIMMIALKNKTIYIKADNRLNKASIVASMELGALCFYFVCLFYCCDVDFLFHYEDPKKAD